MLIFLFLVCDSKLVRKLFLNTYNPYNNVKVSGNCIFIFSLIKLLQVSWSRDAIVHIRTGSSHHNAANGDTVCWPFGFGHAGQLFLNDLLHTLHRYVSKREHLLIQNFTKS